MSLQPKYILRRFISSKMTKKRNLNLSKRKKSKSTRLFLYMFIWSSRVWHQRLKLDLQYKRRMAGSLNWFGRQCSKKYQTLYLVQNCDKIKHSQDSNFHLRNLDGAVSISYALKVNNYISLSVLTFLIWTILWSILFRLKTLQ